MQLKLKSGKVIDLSEEELKELTGEHHSENFDSEKLEEYFTDMHKKAHANLEILSNERIDTEKDLKMALSHVMRYGTYYDAADMIVETIECKVSKMILESME